MSKVANQLPQFGTFLRQARETRGLSLGWVSQVTKVPQSSLQMIEAGDLSLLPPPVFVRGFVRSYARAIGISDIEPLELFDRTMDSIRREKEKELLPLVLDGDLLGVDGLRDDDAPGARRGVGLSIFVVIVLVLATITVSYLMRQPPAPGEGLSQLLAPESVQIQTTVGVEDMG
jgi:cytoskeleton protein RodZ